MDDIYASYGIPYVAPVYHEEEWGYSVARLPRKLTNAQRAAQAEKRRQAQAEAVAAQEAMRQRNLAWLAAEEAAELIYVRQLQYVPPESRPESPVDWDNESVADRMVTPLDVLMAQEEDTMQGTSSDVVQTLATPRRLGAECSELLLPPNEWPELVGPSVLRASSRKSSHDHSVGKPRVPLLALTWPVVKDPDKLATRANLNFSTVPSTGSRLTVARR